MPDIGIVDLGSNSARMVVYAYEPGRWYRLIDDIREPIRLGEGLWKKGRLKKSARARAIASLKMFADYARARNLEALELMGTSAVRDATNADSFLNEVRKLGLEIPILSGEEEARLGVLAVANGFALDSAWVLDLGGGSLQISRMEDRLYTGGTAYPLGAVRLTETHFKNDPPSPEETAQAEKVINRTLEPVLKAIRKDDAPLVAMGGTIRNLALYAQDEEEYALPLVHGYLLQRPDLEWITDNLISLPASARENLPGISSSRADIIVAGALVYRAILQKTRREGFLISGHGLREGAFFQHLLPAPHLLDDVRRFSVENLFQRAAQPPAHTSLVRRLAQKLFDALQPLHELGPEHAELLDAAAVLHDIGTAVHYYSHHKHGAYLVGAAALDGFSHREQAMILQLVRYHHKGTPKRFPFRDLITSKEKPALLALACCLRLAEYLERSRSGRVRDVGVEIGEKEVRLSLVSDEPPTVELWETQKQGRLFERAFRRRLALEATASLTPAEA